MGNLTRACKKAWEIVFQHNIIFHLLWGKTTLCNQIFRILFSMSEESCCRQEGSGQERLWIRNKECFIYTKVEICLHSSWKNYFYSAKMEGKTSDHHIFIVEAQSTNIFRITNEINTLLALPTSLADSLCGASHKKQHDPLIVPSNKTV